MDHTSVEYHYTKEVSHIVECTYTEDTSTPTQLDHTSVEYHYTKEVSYIAEWTYTEGTCTPPLQLTIDVWNTIIPNKFHI